jgi:hypothetical protein
VLTVVDMNVQMHGTSDYDMLCMNVGKRVKSFPAGTMKPEEMMQQTLDGAQWIPACLLEILPFQPMPGLMNAVHTTEMVKHPVHSPAENARLVNRESLNMLNIKSGNTNMVSNIFCALVIRSLTQATAEPGLQAR